MAFSIHSIISLQEDDMARVGMTVSIDEKVRQELEVVSRLLGYSLSSYVERALAEAVQADKERFPKAYAAALEAQEEVRQTRSA